ncbi:uncharacterized protein PgNI_04839 [Pyricularia grisea]|uniref:Rhamnogalacturonase A/B/Epimerase-like pectate lyase domain-containing protein n=1 Tax=Pyricularia grisea TaxID=148305 RepID=A0A6P8B9Q6_PYRGI|nr:uncharacterized protein PgNI_04839 [Pyricularia grisea]TLD12554.1 hypothetical protein PgNI_04839 [Pyricularia grisea]
MSTAGPTGVELEDEEDIDDEEHEPLEGNTAWDVGWTYVDAGYFMVWYENLHLQSTDWETWEMVYERPSAEGPKCSAEGRYDNNTMRAVVTKNGSGGHMSDLTFTGGKWGIYGGNQQFTGQHITFKNCTVAAQLIWEGLGMEVDCCRRPSNSFRMITSRGIGGTSIIESIIRNTDTAVAMCQST